MNRYKRPVFLCLILFYLLYLSIPVILDKTEAWIERYQVGSNQLQAKPTSNSLVYPVKPEQWINFNIPEGVQQLKIISNAHIKRPDTLTIEDNWTYVLRYQLIDHYDQVIVDSLYHQRSRLTAYRTPDNEIFFGNFYSGYDFTPLDGRLILLSIPEVQQAKSLRISVIRQSHEIEETAIRVYVPRKLSAKNLSSVWLRMSNKHKEALAKHSVYPATLLSETEKTNLLTQQWQPVGPAGIEGIDYESKTLYIIKELEQDNQGELLVAAGLQINAEYPGIIAIPESGGELSIRLTELDGTPLLNSVNAQLNWYGRLRQQRWQRTVNMSPENDHVNFAIGGGLLEIKSLTPALVHAMLKTANGEDIDITPKPLMIPGYIAKQGINYQVLHVNNQPTTFRVDIRKIYTDYQSDLPATVKFQWYDKNQQLLDSGELPINPGLSSYDRLTGDQQAFKVSDPVSYFLNIPGEVSQIKLTSERDDLIVNTYNQPYQFRKILQVPENSYVSLDKKNWFPSWFLLRPSNQQTLIKQLGMIKVATQYRPPQNKLESFSQQYFWEDYQPEQRTIARYILAKMDIPVYRDEALASVYCQLKANRRNRVKLKSYGNLPQVSPELLFKRTKHSPFDVSVQIDNSLNLELPAIGKQGSFRLPALSRGLHNISLSTPGHEQWLMNYVSTCPTQSFLKRRVFKFKNRQLSFLIENKQSKDRVFSARFFSKYGIKDRSVIDVSIEPVRKRVPGKIQNNWTYTKRRYDIRPPAGMKTIVLNSHGRYLNSGESFFIPFNSDMPKGLYRIRLHLRQGATGYLALSQITPGLHEQLRFYNETHDQNF